MMIARQRQQTLIERVRWSMATILGLSAIAWAMMVVAVAVLLMLARMI